MHEVALELQPCCGKRSGIGYYTWQLARHIQNNGPVHYHGELYDFIGRGDPASSIAGITLPISCCRIFPYGVYRRVWSVLPLRHEQFFPRSDLHVFFNYIVPPRIDGRVISTIHDLTYFRFPETMKPNNRRMLETGLRRSVAQSAYLITVSDFSKREICSLLDFPPERIFVVPNAASVSDEREDFTALRKRFGIKGDYLLFTGTIEPRKNLERLIEAYSLLRERGGTDASLVLCGGKGWKSEAIYSAASRSRYREDIIFTGYVTDAEKNTLYRFARGFCFPSLYEGFGVPPLEAMHFSCPVLCADAASLPEVCGDAASYVDPYDIGDIADGLDRLLHDDALRSSLISAGQSRSTFYRWSDSAALLQKICESVLEDT